MRKHCSRCNRSRVLVVGCTLFWLFAAIAPVAEAWDGELDTGFAGDGIMAILMGSDDSSGQGVAVQADGTYVLVGVATDSNEDFGLARVTPIGSMDPSFGTSGKVYWDSGWGDDGGWDVAVQDDGKIVAVGTSRLESASHLTVLRFDTDGTPDVTFGHNGFSIINFGVNSYGRGLVIQPDGKIVVVGNSDSATFAVARLDTAGVLDPAFGIGGVYDDGILVPRGDRDAWDVGLLPNGWIVVVGSNHINPLLPHVPGGDYFCVQVMESDGSRLSHTNIDFGGYSEARGVAVQPDGKIVVVGFTDVNTAIAVARLNAAGVLDSSFGGDGKITKDFEEGPDEGWDLALQLDGKIIVVGSAVVDGMLKCVVLRLLEGGNWDKFGPEPGGSPQGYVAFDFMGDSRARGVVLLPNAKIVVVGDAVAALGRYVYLAARLNLPSLEIFADGFESGNTTAWSSTIP